MGFPSALAWKNDARFKGYGPEPDPKVLLAGCAEYFDPISIGQIQPADVLVMSYALEPMHFAIVAALNPLYVIHALRGAGEVVEHRIDEVWKARIYRAFKFREV